MVLTATKQGIARTLNNAGITKSGSRPTRIKGYSELISGWVSVETSNGFRVSYFAVNNVNLRNKTAEQVEAQYAHRDQRISAMLDRMVVALQSKGYDAELVDDYIVITNTMAVW